MTLVFQLFQCKSEKCLQKNVFSPGFEEKQILTDTLKKVSWVFFDFPQFCFIFH